MSRKPAKRSDADKAWMQPRKGKMKRFAPEYHLIVSEGVDTEQTILDLFELIEKLLPYFD